MASATITAAAVKELREETGAGMMDCKKALEESGGDHDKAVAYLREQGMAGAGKLAGRTTTEGTIGTYVHGGKVGVMVEVGCNTDFVAMNEDFTGFARDIAMHIAAMNPQYVSRDEVPADAVEAEKAIYIKQAEDKPENIREKIAEGKLNKWFSEICLLDQPWIRGKETFDKDVTIDELRNHVINQTGENVEIRRFTRFQLGGE